MCIPCKIIINEGIRALVSSLERILIDKTVRDTLGAVKSDSYIDRLQSIDLVSYHGGVIGGGLKGIIHDLIADGVLHNDVWSIFNGD